MPAIQASSKILVTGASGFLAGWVIKTYLQNGFSVRGTVRTAKQGDYLKAQYDAEYPGKFEYIVVPRIDQVSCNRVVIVCASYSLDLFPERRV